MNDVAKVNNYLKGVIESSFKKESRDYNPNDIIIRYILVRTPERELIMYPLYFWCRYERVRRLVTKTLSKYMKNSIGIYYGRIEKESGYHVNFAKCEGQVDVNYSVTAFDVNTIGNKCKRITLSVFDKSTDDWPEGECMISGLYEKLIFKYRNITAEDYRRIQSVNRDDDRLHLPDNFRHNWNDYYKLYVETFGVRPAAKYKFICGNGVKEVEVE